MDEDTGPVQQRIIVVGKGSSVGTNNAIYTSKYNLLNFFPIAIREQFRRNGNLYFLVMGCLMFLGTYTTLFESSVSPWTTLGPLALVVSISLCQEVAADAKRHRSDHITNTTPCIVLRRKEDTDGIGQNDTLLGGHDIDVKIVGSLDGNSRTPRKERSFRKSLSGSDHGGSKSQPQVTRPTTSSVSTTSKSSGRFVPIKFQNIKRMDIRAGDIILVKNREMIPADMILLGSSGENGAAYIETSPIDGETNLKLRNSPQLPITSLPISTPHLSQGLSDQDDYTHPKLESLERAVKRITRISLLGHPEGVSSLLNPNNPDCENVGPIPSPQRSKSSKNLGRSMSETQMGQVSDDGYVSTLTTEVPNASVNTFSGKITLPPSRLDEASIDIPLDAENILLRGAMLRNTEWVLGVACFTGEDTKLARNSIKTPSKFSKLDELMNRTVILILLIMIICVLGLSVFGFAVHNERFDDIWYLGFAEENTPWPYLKIIGDDGQEIYPNYRRDPPGFHQFVFTFITLLNNFVPLSLYVTVEFVTLFMMFMLGWDREMYHAETDTPAVARSTTITDLGQVKYIFSDKTGTLTQNVMRFKRCSVDGSIFGAPVVKEGSSDNDDDMNNESMRTKYHSLQQLLVGSINLKRVEKDDRAENTDDNIVTAASGSEKILTFNAEMFLRVMSICHTVVVEKEIDASNLNNKSNDEKAEKTSLFKSRRGNRSRNNTSDDFEAPRSPLGAIIEANSVISAENESLRTPGMDMSVDMSIDRPLTSHSLVNSTGNVFFSETPPAKVGKSADGSPAGFAYQAESPDEGALVSAASLDFGFQLISRDSDGVKLSCDSPSLLSINAISDRLKKGTLTARELAAETACPRLGDTNTNPLRNALKSWCQDTEKSIASGTSDEVWSILAVNKFDSTRKRMSVLVRSPPELGSIPMLLIKGADSSMLDPDICVGGDYIASGSLGDDRMKDMIQTIPNSFEESLEGCAEWEKSVLLNMQSQLGIFASEGLRTLVLGVRILSEHECDDWLSKFSKAATAIENRDVKLTAVAMEIETKIHIVGSTAIEDKLQDGVPQTIENIAKAGIKLWVLTGDKRETAIEIGYSTKVLNPDMHLTDVADGSPARVKAMIAMEFMRLVKIGKLAMYQKNAQTKKSKLQRFFWPIIVVFSAVGSVFRFLSITWRRFYFTFIATGCGLFRRDFARTQLGKIKDEMEREQQKEKGRHLQIRNLAERILQEYKMTREYRSESKLTRKKSIRNFHPGGDGPNEEPVDALPEVFHRASNANTILDIQSGTLNSASIRGLSLMTIASDENAAPNADSQPVIDDDVMSLISELPGKSKGQAKIFNKKKRTVLEKVFAVDKDVRKGRLIRHLTKEKKIEVNSAFAIVPQNSAPDVPDGINAEIDRALVIEGSAVAHFLGDPMLEEMLFAVASNCESVIACRVSPKQKALLVKLVKQFVVPTPVTLAIGDGANDVGMIQEAQIGVGISGLEGQQAVNSSDFAIAQFRFLENLLLVHGRWNFMRLSKVVLFSFYKNAVLAGLLILYSRDTLYSGEPLFDMWSLSTFNFVNGWAIIFFGMFDRDVDKDYVKKNPILYAAGPNNEHMALRITLRWIALVFLHANIIYFVTDIGFDTGSTQSPAFHGLMANVDKEHPGDGDGSDLKIFGNLVFVILNWVLALKVLYESGSIIHGKEPALLGCSKKSKEGFYSRAAWTWHGVIFLCIGFNFFYIYTYDEIGKAGVSSFSPFVSVTYHTLNTRSISWMIFLLAVVLCQVVDVSGKLFSNMFYPTQTQIHREIQVLRYKKERREEKRRERSPDFEMEV